MPKRRKKAEDDWRPPPRDKQLWIGGNLVRAIRAKQVRHEDLWAVAKVFEVTVEDIDEWMRTAAEKAEQRRVKRKQYRERKKLAQQPKGMGADALPGPESRLEQSRAAAAETADDTGPSCDEGADR